MIEGAGSGSIPLTNGSGSRRPKNIWIRIRNTGNMISMLHLTYPFAATNNAKGSVAQLANQLSLFVSYLDITFLNVTISRQNWLIRYRYVWYRYVGYGTSYKRQNKKNFFYVLILRPRKKKHIKATASLY